VPFLVRATLALLDTYDSILLSDAA
jgi:hypothetical protein